MRSRFDKQLSLLSNKMIEMGAECESIIARAAKALIDGNVEAAGTIAELSGGIDRMEREIESECLKLLLQQQPVASDLRTISAALKMITDMKRIGDQARDIAETTVFLGGRTGNECHGISNMARSTIKMVTESINAYVRRDVELAREVCAADDIVDNDFNEIRKTLIAMIASDPSNGEYALDLLMIAKHFEKIGDHAVNIAKWVEFSVTGVHRGDD